MTFGIIVDAADQAAAQVDYTPAFIGLCGVLIGGLIQVGAQIAKERSARVAAARADVMDFAHRSLAFVDYTADMVSLRATKQWDRLPTEKQVTKATAMSEEIRSIHLAGVSLAKVSDARVADYGYEVLNSVLNYNRAHGGLYAPDYRPLEGSTALTYELKYKINILINMVYPRKYETHLRFRSQKESTRIVDKDSAP